MKNKKGDVLRKIEDLEIKTKQPSIDFSTGYLFSFVGDENYELSVDNSGNAIALEGNDNNFTHALGGLMHVYNRSWFGGMAIGISPGLSLTTEGDLGFYTGISTLFFGNNRLAITTGYSWVKKQKLNTSNLSYNNENRYYEFRNSDLKEIKYDRVYDGAFFIGLTYNLSKSE